MVRAYYFAALLAFAILAGCESTPSQTAAYPSAYPSQTAGSYEPGIGTVQAVAAVQVPEAVGDGGGIAGSGVGVGTIAGGVVGAILGSQIGHGTGRTAATLGGAAGGAYLGHRLEGRHEAGTQQGYQLSLLMDNGTRQTIVQNNSGFRPGDRVQVTADGRVIRL